MQICLEKLTEKLKIMYKIKIGRLRERAGFAVAARTCTRSHTYVHVSGRGRNSGVKTARRPPFSDRLHCTAAVWLSLCARFCVARDAFRKQGGASATRRGRGGGKQRDPRARSYAVKKKRLRFCSLSWVGWIEAPRALRHTTLTTLSCCP